MRLLFSKLFLFVAIVCLSPMNHAWAQFDFDFEIDPNLIDSFTNTSTGTITAAQEAQLNTALDNSAAFWEQFIVGFNPAVTNPLTGIDIGVGLSNFADPVTGTPNGSGGALAAAGPSGFNSDFIGGGAGFGGFTFLIEPGTNQTRLGGQVSIDSADFGLLGTPIFDNILNHEIGHALGFGTLFTDNGVYVDESGQYTGLNGLAAYQAEFDPSATFVPIELDGGEGTRNGHLNEVAGFGAQEDVIPDPNGPGLTSDPGGENDPGDVGVSQALTVLTPGDTFGLSQDLALLTGRISGSTNTFLSDTTVATFADIGFDVRLPSEVRAAETVPEPSSLALLGIAAFAIVTRRRR